MQEMNPKHIELRAALLALYIFIFLLSGEDCNMDGFTFDTRAEDLRHVWIPMTLKMSISKSQGLEISSWPEGEEVRGKHFLQHQTLIQALCLSLADSFCGFLSVKRC